MKWLALLLVVAVLGWLLASWRRKWVQPLHDLEEMVNALVRSRSPRTFLIDGNPLARRIGIALEDVFVRQRDLRSRAEEGEFNVRTILGAMQDGLAVIDPKGRVGILNAAAGRLFGRAPDETGGTALETFRDSIIAKVIDETLHTSAPANVTVKLRASEGGDRQVAITSLPMQDEKGAVVLFHDVTQLQQLEQVRRDFVSNVSHELRTPLSIFRGYLETLLEEPNISKAERLRILQVMEKHSERLQSLVNDLLSLARLEAPEPDLQLDFISPSEFFERVMNDWEKKAAAKKLRIVLQVADDLPPLRADEARLEEVVYNLLDNAVKHSPPNHEIMVRLLADEESIIIEVADQGTGIASADLPRIFERFYRADRARSRELGGTGLGLSIVKHIVQLHGGSVTAHSDVGRGTLIRVKIPAVRQLEAAAL